MITLKQVVHYLDTNSVEATWVDTIEGQEVAVKCHSYADVQMDMLRTDLGANASTYTSLIATVEAAILPPPPTPQAELIRRIEEAKQERIDKLTVTTASGKTFRAGEVWQGRMVRALAGLDVGETIPWVLANATTIIISRIELKEALRLAIQQEMAIRSAPYNF